MRTVAHSSEPATTSPSRSALPPLNATFSPGEVSGRGTPSLLDTALTAGWLRRVLTESDGGSKRVASTPLVPRAQLRCLSPVNAAGRSPPAAHPPPAAEEVEKGRPVADSVLKQHLNPVGPQQQEALRSALRTPAPENNQRPNARSQNQQSNAHAVRGTACDQVPSAAGVTESLQTTAEYLPAPPPELHMPPVDDQFSGDERTIVRMLTACRANPASFAHDLEMQYQFRPPDVPVMQNVVEARETLAGMEKSLAEANAQQVAQRTSHLTETAAIQEQLDELSGGGSPGTGKKGKPAPKKGKPVAPPEEDLKKLTALLETTKARHAQIEAATQEVIQRISTAAARCSAAVARVDGAISFLNSQQPLRPFRYSRGLSMVARDRAAAIGQGKSVDEEVSAEQLNRYGLSLGLTGCTQTVGSPCSSAAAFDALCDPDTRAAMFRPEFLTIGCGWQRHRDAGSVAVFVLAESYSDCRHVRLRAHHALNEVQHQFAISVDPFLFPIAFLGDFGVEPADPLEHPIPCNSTAVLRLKVPEGVQIEAAWEREQDDFPPSPRTIQGVSVFTQREGNGKVRINVSAPGSGFHVLAVFARRSGEVAFTRVGAVKFKTDEWLPGYRAVQFPEPAAAFVQRRVVLVEPFRNPLPSSGSTFTVRLLNLGTQQKASELQLQLQQKEEAVREAERKAESLEAEAESLNSELPPPPPEPATSPSPSKGRKNSMTLASSGADAFQEKLTEIKLAQSALLKEAEVHRRTARQLNVQARVLSLGVQKEAKSPSEGARVVEVVSGNSRRQLHRVSVHKHYSQWQRNEVPLQPGSAALFVDGDCVLRWTVV